VILHPTIEALLKSAFESELMREKLELRVHLIKDGYAKKTEYERNEIDILRMVTENKIEQLKPIIKQRTLELGDTMRIYFQELEALRKGDE
jgi:hypothetical protein